ncbi:MAG: PD-(D/E)XK nuclease family protein [Candidatus Zhuqueibacterota bacterium]
MKVKKDFTERLLNLISEPQFIKFENILSEPNFFKIVGRAHYERWHSCFLGWLLDPGGSHLLSHYTLLRFLLILLDERCLKSIRHHNYLLLKILPTVEFWDVDVVPNENISKETSISGVGRFDIFISTRYKGIDNHEGRLNCIIELKIDSTPDANQSKKYADWLIDNHENDENLLVYLTPNLLDNSKNTIGDDRWYCIDYQLLNDKFLLPLTDHPNLNEKVKPFIIQYIKNLKIRYKGIKMAITNEEKKLAIALYEKYSDIFDSIYDALVITGTVDYSTSDLQKDVGRVYGRIAVKVDKKVMSNDTVRLLFLDVLKYLVDENLVLKLPLPWGSSNKRYLITNETVPKHPNGRDFFYPVRYLEYTMESHFARERGLKVLADLCRKLEVEFEIIDT